MSTVTLKNLTKDYPNGFRAITDLSLHLDDGEFLVLVGPSGCGKSTRAAHDRRTRGHHQRRPLRRRPAP